MRNPDLEKVTLNLRRGDMDFLASVCEPKGIATSFLIRELVAAKVDELRRRLDPPTERINLDAD